MLAVSSESVREVLFDMQIKKHEEIKKKDSTDFFLFFLSIQSGVLAFPFFFFLNHQHNYIIHGLPQSI